LFSFFLININYAKVTARSAMHGKGDSIQDFSSSIKSCLLLTLLSGTDWYIQTRTNWLSLTTTSIPVSGILRQLEGNTGKYGGGE
jgi:hypothetical protein